MADVAAVAAKGLKRAKRALGKLDEKEMKKTLRQAHRDIGKKAKQEAKSFSTGPQVKRALSAVQVRPTDKKVTFGLRNTKRVPFLAGALLGSKKYGQFPPWVGNTWDLQKGTGPAAYRDYVPARQEQIAKLYRDSIADAVASALK